MQVESALQRCFGDEDVLVLPKGFTTSGSHLCCQMLWSPCKADGRPKDREGRLPPFGCDELSVDPELERMVGVGDDASLGVDPEAVFV